MNQIDPTIQKITKSIKFGGEEQRLVTVYSVDTWGSFGQHDKTMIFVLEQDNKFNPAWLSKDVVWENKDSRKNRHRTAYRDVRTLEGKVLKIVSDYKSSGRKLLTVQYYIVQNADLCRLEHQSFAGVDIVLLPDNRKMRVNRDSVTFQ